MKSFRLLCATFLQLLRTHATLCVAPNMLHDNLCTPQRVVAATQAGRSSCCIFTPSLVLINPARVGIFSFCTGLELRIQPQTSCLMKVFLCSRPLQMFHRAHQAVGFQVSSRPAIAVHTRSRLWC
jgi:hypothetical protein